MENTPFGPQPYEAPSTGAEKPYKDNKKGKKKSSGVEAPAVEKKQKAQQDLAKSIDRLPLFERPEKTEATKQPEARAEQPVDELTVEEQQHVQQETAREHLAAIEQADAETAEQLEPAVEFLQRVADGQDVETAFNKAAAEAGLSEDEVTALGAETETDILTEADEETAPEEGEPQAEASDDGVIDTSSTNEGVVGWRTAAASSADGGRRGGSGTTPPPTPPARTPQPSGSVPPTSNRAPVPAEMPETASAYYQERRRAGDLLLIGLVGYLIGRRRGRIRTEKRLLPVQRKLEKQVKSLEQDITRKEQQLVAIKAQNQPAAEARPAVTPAERTQPGRTETRLGMEKPVRAERLGHMVIAAEAPRKTAERPQASRPSPEKPNNIRQAFRPEAVPDMSRNDLLELSEKIVVEGASLRRIYESNLVGEKQLRYLVSEYLKGHDIRKELRHEMIEHEIDFERDPILRDRVRSRLADGDGGGGLGAMLAKAGITEHEADPSLEHRIQRDQQRQAVAERKRQQKRRLVDTSMVTAIVVLAVIVAILALR